METERIALLSESDRKSKSKKGYAGSGGGGGGHGGASRQKSFDNGNSSSSSSSGADEDTFCTCIPGSGDTCYHCHLKEATSGERDNKGFKRSGANNRHLSITVLDSSGEHCHDDEFQREIDKKARKKLWMASGLCVVFMIAEAIGGILAGSLAVATDAAHLLTDFAGFMISLFALYISERPATKRLSYGYHRAEVIGALTSVLLIWVVTGILVYMATQRLILKEFEIDAPIMLITSGVGLVVNIIMGCTLHQHAHSHGGGSGHSHGGGGGASHGHSHQYGTTGSSNPHKTTTTTPPQGNTISTRSYQNGGLGITNPNLDVEIGEGNEEVKDHEGVTILDGHQGGGGGESSTATSSACGSSTDISHVAHAKQNVNVRAAFIHVIGDFIQSVGVFAAAIVIYFCPSWVIVDPICTYVFSILVLATTYAIVKETVFVLMEGIPKGLDFNDVRETLLHVKGVRKVHNLRIWSLSMDRIALSAHLAIDQSSNSSNILRKSSQLVKVKYGFSEVTIQIEDFNEKMQDCRKCQELN